MYHIFFIHPSVDGHLGYFHFLAIVNTLQKPWKCQCVFDISISFPLDICHIVTRLDPMVALFSVLYGSSIVLFIMTILMYILTTSVKGSFFSTSSPAQQRKTQNQIDLTDIYRTFHPEAAEYTLFSSAHGPFSR